MDLENMKCNSKDKIFHNKCKFCGKDLKPIGLDYLYANIPLSSIEYERCNCEESKAVNVNMRMYKILNLKMYNFVQN